MSTRYEKNRHFSLIKDRKTNQHVLMYGSVRYAIAYCDYDGNLDRPIAMDKDWFLLHDDFDSVMAWHGEYKQDENNPKKVWGKVSFSPRSENKQKQHV
jgi:hypothetical protein